MDKFLQLASDKESRKQRGNDLRVTSIDTSNLTGDVLQVVLQMKEDVKKRYGRTGEQQWLLGLLSGELYQVSPRSPSSSSLHLHAVSGLRKPLSPSSILTTVFVVDSLVVDPFYPFTYSSTTQEVIVDKAEKSDIPNIDKKKYLFPTDLTIRKFVYGVPGDLNEDFFKNENDDSFMNDIVFL
ncbi:unnamed protein product [Lactuca virosa]|uniref:Uncharacterized protein n=1 Tax=Lactuca virosa TaxID=75947 RepID=A0AAU9PIN1_9ASTR|nr:unnamed protein product [Lactuca virosa]